MEMEVCVRCGDKIELKEVRDTVDWLLVESNYSLDEGPYCSLCAPYRKAEE